jgi:hypothetical protein
LVGAFDEASRLPKLANLWITSALYAPEKNTVGCLAQVLRVTDSLLASSSLAETAGTEARAEAETV